MNISEKEILNRMNNVLKKYNKSGKSNLNYLEDTWKELMIETGTYNKFAESLTLKNIKEETYGFTGYIIIPPGLTENNLNKIDGRLKESIKNITGYYFYYYIEQNSMIRCKFVYKHTNCESVPIKWF